MAKYSVKNRRRSTVIRYEIVLKAYDKVLSELGDYACLVPKAHIYELVREETGLCDKTIAFVINHIKKK